MPTSLKRHLGDHYVVVKVGGFLNPPDQEVAISFNLMEAEFLAEQLSVATGMAYDTYKFIASCGGHKWLTRYWAPHEIRRSRYWGEA